jgi:hypothetical protein
VDDDHVLRVMEQAGVAGPPLRCLGDWGGQRIERIPPDAQTVVVGTLLLEATGLLTAAESPDDPAAWLGELQRVLEELRRAVKVPIPEKDTHAVLLRDIFGNPFRPRPVIDPTWLRWNDGTVPRLAQAIYEARRFDDLPILHDALLDAGCDDQDILDHLRSPGPHVRGCWVIDLILGKE